MRVGMKRKYPILFQGRYCEESRTWRPVEHDISDLQILELCDDPVSTWLRTDRVPGFLMTGQKGPEHPFGRTIPPFGVAVPASTVHTHLYQPWPDLCCTSLDGDGMGRFDHRMRYQLISRHWSMHFVITCSPAASLSAQIYGRCCGE